MNQNKIDMNIQEVKTELQKIPQMKDFVWNQDNYATMKVSPRNFKDSGKNEYNLCGSYSVFIAHMYEGEADKEFFYIIMEREGMRREFNKKKFYEIEFNKRYISGKTVAEVSSNFKELFDDAHNPYEFL